MDVDEIKENTKQQFILEIVSKYTGKPELNYKRTTAVSK